jgi:hypothetical protein
MFGGPFCTQDGLRARAGTPRLGVYLESVGGEGRGFSLELLWLYLMVRLTKFEMELPAELMTLSRLDRLDVRRRWVGFPRDEGALTVLLLSGEPASRRAWPSSLAYAEDPREHDVGGREGECEASLRLTKRRCVGVLALER